MLSCNCMFKIPRFPFFNRNIIHALLNTLKHYTLSPRAFRSLDEAVVTAGGIDVSEIDPKTMKSKKIDGLFFAGEIIDLDAYTGGYNLQIAWSTGRKAGESAAEYTFEDIYE